MWRCYLELDSVAAVRRARHRPIYASIGFERLQPTSHFLICLEAPKRKNGDWISRFDGSRDSWTSRRPFLVVRRLETMVKRGKRAAIPETALVCWVVTGTAEEEDSGVAWFHVGIRSSELAGNAVLEVAGDKHIWRFEKQQATNDRAIPVGCDIEKTKVDRYISWRKCSIRRRVRGLKVVADCCSRVEEHGSRPLPPLMRARDAVRGSLVELEAAGGRMRRPVETQAAN
ncbi:unnamed protein product [Lactuca virosa]|uniref:Uncharacterized protein n=1 Tax=Lactuca virosa TaxID=75947 RepID=A0AAU9NK91_9ASTR|nr:unnamed protein product [Lactuca virosa]